MHPVITRSHHEAGVAGGATTDGDGARPPGPSRRSWRHLVYTLVSAATLGFDLARLPGGDRVAEVLLAALRADAPAVRALARQHRTHCVLDDPATTVRADAGQVRRARELAVSGSERIVDLTSPSGAGLLAQLERRTLGDVIALERLVHGDLLEVPDVDERAATLAREVLADAVVAAYSGPSLPADLRALLPAAYDDATATATAGAGDVVDVDAAAAPAPARADELGPCGEQVLAALASLARESAAWQGAADAVREGSGAWARSMHAACWAAEVSGRTRATATAQLLAVRSLASAGVTAAQAAGGLWNAAAGVVQALVVADLLDDDDRERLLAPWLAVGAPGAEVRAA